MSGKYPYSAQLRADVIVRKGPTLGLFIFSNCCECHIHNMLSLRALWRCTFAGPTHYLLLWLLSWYFFSINSLNCQNVIVKNCRANIHIELRQANKANPKYSGEKQNDIIWPIVLLFLPFFTFHLLSTFWLKAKCPSDHLHTGNKA